MRTTSFALLFSATVSAPAFAGGDAPASPYRPDGAATASQEGKPAIVDARRDDVADEGAIRS
jgi:hypothetical protein